MMSRPLTGPASLQNLFEAALNFIYLIAVDSLQLYSPINSTHYDVTYWISNSNDTNLLHVINCTGQYMTSNLAYVRQSLKLLLFIIFWIMFAILFFI
jgi:hypothetical protein